ncbi:hypothetical protein LXA43DRAFT_519538 [Ganoderma leucocontextum]|nr:hypothetical protein LXA43DRAFT_519538 [Ganoderma leucocontextum]
MSSEAGPPFNEPTADIVICSSDQVTFRLHRIILSLASDFFKDMLSLPQPGNEPHLSELPMINVTEPSDVLERLFRLCYPVDDPVLGTLHELCSTLEAALKYQMAEAIKITKRKLRSFASSEPLRAYAIACRFDLEAEAEAAAKEVLSQHAQGEYVVELEEISIGAYHRLLSYCERKGRVSDRFRFTFHTSGGGRERPTPASTPSLAEAVLEPVVPDVLPEPQVAPHPFDSTDAEVTLVASDGMEFRVFASILQVASPALFSKVSELQPPTPMRISVSEPSRILSILLQICYPVPDPRLSDLHDISAALVAAEKYKMQHACQNLRAALSARKDDASEDPVLLYATACRFRIYGLALAAARRTLRTDIMKSPVSELDSIGVFGGCLFRLLAYHERCRTVVQSMFRNSPGDWVDPEIAIQLQDTCPLSYNSGSWKPCWYEPYMNRLSQEHWPSVDSVTNEDLLQSILDSTRDPNGYPCNYCVTARGAFLFVKFSKHVAEAIRAEEHKQPLHWVLAAPQADA